MRENQKFAQLWVKIVLGIPVLSLAIILILASFEKGALIEFSKSEFVIMVGVFLSMMLVAYLILKLELRTEITNEAIRFQFFPFHKKFREYKWTEVQRVEVREYSPLSEYGGWGIRISVSGKGRAYNVAGNKGIQLYFKNGKKLLIGTQKPEKVEAVLRTYKVILPEFSKN